MRSSRWLAWRCPHSETERGSGWCQGRRPPGSQILHEAQANKNMEPPDVGCYGSKFGTSDIFFLCHLRRFARLVCAGFRRIQPLRSRAGVDGFHTAGQFDRVFGKKRGCLGSPFPHPPLNKPATPELNFRRSGCFCCLEPENLDYGDEGVAATFHCGKSIRHKAGLLLR